MVNSQFKQEENIVEIKGEEKYLAELDITLKKAKILINILSDDCNNTKFNKYLNTLQDIREDVQNKIIDIS